MDLLRWHTVTVPALMEGRRQYLALTGGKIDPMEIEVEQVLLIDGQDVSTRRERVTSVNQAFRQDFWASAENNLKDFRQKVNAYEHEEPPF